MHKFQETSLPIEKRIDALLDELTVDEKLGFIDYRNQGVERLGIAPYSWWNEALHGLARSGTATVFPQAIAMAATFSPEWVKAMGDVIAIETRARYFSSIDKGDYDTYKGLTQWSPNINIFRDPRWGRGHETYGECPFLSGLLGFAFVRGLQGPDTEHLLTAATPKHFAVHSGPESGRANFNSVVDERDLRETYLPAFKTCIVEAKAQSVMSAYNAINGEPCSTNQRLLMDILRDEWKFDGAVVTDVGVLRNLVAHHKTQPDGAHAIQAELVSGVDVVSDWLKGDEVDAFKQGLISEEDLDRALRNQLRVKFRLGMFDPKRRDVPPFESIACSEHRGLSLEAARRSIVLLKNSDGLLPIQKDQIKTIAVIGPNATHLRSLLGNYNGTPLRPVTPLAGIQNAVGEGIRIFYAQGCEPSAVKTEGCAIHDHDRFSEALTAAEHADLIIGCFGLTPDMEGEEGDASNADASGDKMSIELPRIQQELIEALAATGTPMVLVNLSGSAVAIPDAKVSAVVQCFYPGECGGTALSDVLFGAFNPCGRLPVTFYRTTDDLPPFDDYSMVNRTYRFFTGTPQYPFGYGLSYTTFGYSDLVVNRGVDGTANASVTVTNTGTVSGEEVVLLYVSLPEASTRTPLRQLAAVGRVSLAPGESQAVDLTIWANSLQAVLEDGTTTCTVGNAVISVANLNQTLPLA